MLRQRIIQRLAALVHQQRQQPAAVGLEQLRRPFKRAGARLGRRAVPGRKATRSGLHRPGGGVRTGLDDAAQRERQSIG